MYKYSKVFICLLSLTFLVSCTSTTTGIWNTPTYTENISRFLATVDGENIIFIGEDYHYIFKNNASLKNILTYKDRGLLEAQLENSFTIDKSNNIGGNFRIICKCTDATNKQINELKSIGFVKSLSKNLSLKTYENTYNLKIELSGTRYSTNNLDLSNYSTLNKTYKVKIRQPHTNSSIAVRTALTPVAVAEDGVATLMLIPIMAIALPFYIIEKITGE